MVITKMSLLTVAALAWGPGASADSLLPDHLVRATDGVPWAHSSTTAWLTARAIDRDDPIAYLAETTTGALLAEAEAEPAEPARLVEALNRLGPFEVSMADYLTMALPGLMSGPADGQATTATTATTADLAQGSPAAALLAMNFAPAASAEAAPRPTTASTDRWALPGGLSERLTQYLFLSAVAALLAGAGLHMARWARRSTRLSLGRL